MKRLALILLILAAGITLLLLAWCWFPDIRDRSRIQRAYELAVRPATDWVRDFHQRHSRLHWGRGRPVPR